MQSQGHARSLGSSSLAVPAGVCFGSVAGSERHTTCGTGALPLAGPFAAVAATRGVFAVANTDGTGTLGARG